MKLSFLAAAALSSVNALLPLEGVPLESEFQSWAAHYGLAFEESELKSVMGKFEINREVVVKHNAEYAEGLHTFNLELNEFAHLTNEEYQSQMLGYKALSTSGAKSFHAKFGAAADEFDWREIGNVVGAVKNQGQCGSCWAFSAVATLEGALNNATGKNHVLSEQELVDCTADGDYTCELGGEMFVGVEYAITNGMMSETSYPYKGTSGNNCKYESRKNIHTFSSYSNITSGDEAALKEAAYEHVISIGIDASSIAFQLYNSGIYDPIRCSSKNLDHGVAVVGYGSEDGKDFWIVRNSWGKSWGEDGYVKMIRNKDNKCGVATQACFAEY